MRLVVIGHPCLDIIHKDEKEFKSYGGIIYSLIGFLVVANENDEIYPLFNISREYFSDYFQLIEKYNQVRRDLITIDNSSMNIVHLFFNGENLNFECYQATAQKIEISHLQTQIPVDSNFYINMISGFELELEDLKFIRKNFNGKIYFDFHTLTRKMNEEGKRVYTPIKEWKEWVKHCDVIQLNEIEMISLTPEKLNEDGFVKEAIAAGTKVVNITKGSEGAVSYYASNNEIKKLEIKPEKNLIFKNNVGCGDIFGAVFSYNYFRNEQIEICLKEAVKISSRRIEIEDIESIIDKLKADI